MAQKQILFGAGPKEPEPVLEPGEGWNQVQLYSLVGWMGWTLVLLWGTDFGLTWFPIRLGDRQWEFGTVSASFNGMPSLFVGVPMILVGAAGLKRRIWAAMVAALLLIVTVVVLYGLAIYWTSVPLALNALEGPALLGLKKAIGKTLVQSMVYPVVLVFLMYHAIRIVRVRDAALESSSR